MCGFAGFISSNLNSAEQQRRLMAMGNSLAHRGPDDFGTWVDENTGVSLVHRRLAVIDLSGAAKQPMRSSNGRYWIAYNGEIYNYKSLRSELIENGIAFRSNSDTEVFLESISFWGLEKALGKFAGMFAFALFDTHRSQLFLARDRMGEKPVYYGWVGKEFVFGSELKALRKHPSWEQSVDQAAFAQFLKYGYIPSPFTIHKNIKKLSPGKIVCLKLIDKKWSENEFTWWSYNHLFNTDSRFEIRSLSQEQDRLEVLMSEVLQEHMLADVPIGAFLSGGIDSTILVGLMQKISSVPIQTFTIGYSEGQHDESKYASQIASYLGTQHVQLIVTPNDVMKLIPKLSSCFDEPFGDSSQLPSILISQLARSSVTVAISGDGGDEVFGGYNRYKWAQQYQRVLARVPYQVRNILGECLDKPSASRWHQIFQVLRSVLPERYSWNQPVDKVQKVSSVMRAGSLEEIYTLLTSTSTRFKQMSERSPASLVEMNRDLWDLEGSFAEKMMRLDAVTYLPDDILVKVDRASMSESLEVRSPFLDVRILEYAASLPIEYKIRRGETKVITRGLTKRYLPEHLINRPKSGFSIPIDQWLRGALRDWGEELLSVERLKDDGQLDVENVRTIWDEHVSGKRNNQALLWPVLMFQSWLARQAS